MEHYNLIIKFASIDDADYVESAVKDLLSELRSEPVKKMNNIRRVMEHILDSKSGNVIIAIIDNDIVGMLGYSERYCLHCDGKNIVIEEMWIKKDFRGKGLGRRMMKTLLNSIDEFDDVTRIEVGLPSYNYVELDGVKNFYKKMGFSVIGERMTIKW